MAYIPGSIGRTMQGELFMVDALGVAHNKGTDGFQPLWEEFIIKKKEYLRQLFAFVHANFWDATYKQLLFGRPNLMTDYELCLHMYHRVLASQYHDLRTDKAKIQCVRDYITTWAPHLIDIHPMQSWIQSLISFVSSDVIFNNQID